MGIGASAGGLEAFTQLLKHLPSDTGMGFVLVQHLDPQHPSTLPHLLAKTTSLPVSEVRHNLRVAPNHVYVIPPNARLTIVRGVLQLSERTGGAQRSIDGFLESLAEDQHERAIGIILSGTASDGTLGLEAIKAEGGITFAQDESARFDSMPRSAVAAGCVDFVLPPPRIAQELVRIATHPYVLHASGPPKPARQPDGEGETVQRQGSHAAPASEGGATLAESEAEAPHDAPLAADGFKRVLLLLRKHSEVDFSLYKPGTIRRRVTRRMILSRHHTLDAYATFLQDNPEERDALYSDLLISVTRFFRNPEAFEVLKRRVFPRLLAQARRDEPVRAWVLGCSTGQEAYSLAMAYVEASEHMARAPKLQVFATDLNDALLNKARQGLYSKSLMADVSPQRLRRFFMEEPGGYHRVSKPLREMVVFARQDLISDPPFSRMDLISCRNLLIYLEPAVQNRALSSFHYALKPNGVLFLGASESVGPFTNLFESLDQKYKLFSKKPGPTPAHYLPTAGGQAFERKAPPSLKPGPVLDEFRIVEREADRVLINQFAPPGVLIDAELHVLQFRGQTSAYLELPVGKASFDLLKMARTGLAPPLRSAINTAKRKHTPVRDQAQVTRDGRTQAVTIEVIPLTGTPQQCYVVLFHPVAEKTGRASFRMPPEKPLGERASHKVAALERELAEVRDRLQVSQDQQEAAFEELQASNEEAQSSNEELQSINEELETSKEELVSTNEELTTLNEEMGHRNAELSALNSDLNNLHASIDMAILLLGRDLSIRRFTPPAAKTFNLLAADVGRSLSGLRHNLNCPDLDELVSEVIDTVSVRERNVQDTAGRWYTLRVRPYTTPDNKIDGAVLVLQDIDVLKRGQEEIARARDYAEAILRSTTHPLVVLNHELRVITANNAFHRSFNLSLAETEGRLIYELGDGQWSNPQFHALLEDVLPRNSAFEDIEVTQSFRGVGARVLLVTARRLEQGPAQPPRILMAINDVTELRQMEQSLREREQYFYDLAQTLPHVVWIHLPDGRVDWVNRRWQEYAGQAIAEVQDGPDAWLSAVHPDDRASARAGATEGFRSGLGFSMEVRLRRASDGAYRWFQYRSVPSHDRDGAVLRFLGTCIDIQGFKEAEQALTEADRRKNRFLRMMAHEWRTPLSAISQTLQILQLQDASNPERVRLHALMARQLANLTRMVGELIDHARIASGKITLEKEPIEVQAFINGVVDCVRPLMQSRRHELTVLGADGPALWIEGDALRLEQILTNLLLNAAKYTPPGGRIRLTVEREEGGICLRVQDTGIGISSEILPRIFDMFVQADQSPGAPGGLGLGLAIARSLVEMHGGTIEARSAGIGQGSEFIVHLPTGRLPDNPVRASEAGGIPRPATPRQHRILLVEDNQDSAESLKILLELSGQEVQVANDGATALALAGKFRPDVALVDIGLPDMQGDEVARLLHHEPGLERTVLAALTGWGQEEIQQHPQAHVFDRYFVKPVDIDALSAWLISLDQQATRP